MKKYFSPFVILANGTITLTDSQLGKLGITVDVAQWDEFWEDAKDYFEDNYPNFDVNIPETWPSGFSLSDPDSWYALIF